MEDNVVNLNDVALYRIDFGSYKVIYTGVFLKRPRQNAPQMSVAIVHVHACYFLNRTASGGLGALEAFEGRVSLPLATSELVIGRSRNARNPRKEERKVRERTHRILRIPGEAYISSWRWPLRRRYSMAPKSFLFTERCFWNSALGRLSRSAPRTGGVPGKRHTWHKF